MNKIFNDYLNFIFENENTTSSVFIDLKKYEKEENSSIKIDLENTHNPFQENLFSYPFSIGIDRFFQEMENFHKLYNEFTEKQEISTLYGQACFLVLEMMDEMLYEEYRTLQSVLEKTVLGLLSENSAEVGILLAAGLLRNYLNPHILVNFEKMDFSDPLFQDLKKQVKENLILC